MGYEHTNYLVTYRIEIEIISNSSELRNEQQFSLKAYLENCQH